ncbi:hypothetical protein KM1_143310 [Entamoeba histolytica HM-3:IMSS]|uniref:Uncharacterized protein n=5 Tax=Entamoeba histolytica TaxID=5759 RepID=C4LT00_ENTH1|nr:hypothetical protein EHI_148300 [Entamoeba histolytica HM-1:IMSS]EMD42843.1 Hypothetical protein EHI5A_004480 [Entamoeba histolytica KU27]EMS14926.1 hypothetical protein KM1_143310 [Entamoeba histolytica HM-3:IMSS]ENY63421.1 hypothetical protein EHI7A_075920 [Entamoeba histolytica HM-1:IMSS-A]GAT91668.1 hypothetical protein CL6EHI_148300 [Entamoeba histolytica]EAL52120.1 hypothetical protein EHI_148300 [Entamoeba histolytica HM-1:IMSS]|eukprot:XP_657510.1 hypothetical protein EHI_148300 [Entamoeba histolytica HM-1:IMSS]
MTKQVTRKQFSSALKATQRLGRSAAEKASSISNDLVPPSSQKLISKNKVVIPIKRKSFKVEGKENQEHQTTSSQGICEEKKMEEESAFIVEPENDLSESYINEILTQNIEVEEKKQSNDEEQTIINEELLKCDSTQNNQTEEQIFKVPTIEKSIIEREKLTLKDIHPEVKTDELFFKDNIMEEEVTESKINQILDICCKRYHSGVSSIHCIDILDRIKLSLSIDPTNQTIKRLIEVAYCPQFRNEVLKEARFIDGFNKLIKSEENNLKKNDIELCCEGKTCGGSLIGILFEMLKDDSKKNYVIEMFEGIFASYPVVLSQIYQFIVFQRSNGLSDKSVIKILESKTMWGFDCSPINNEIERIICSFCNKKENDEDFDFMLNGVYDIIISESIEYVNQNVLYQLIEALLKLVKDINNLKEIRHIIIVSNMIVELWKNNDCIFTVENQKDIVILQVELKSNYVNNESIDEVIDRIEEIMRDFRRDI